MAYYIGSQGPFFDDEEEGVPAFRSDTSTEFPKADSVADPAAPTSAAVDAGTVTLAALAAEYNKLRDDYIALRTQFIALLTSLEGGNIIET
jgi:hypothetical protein